MTVRDPREPIDWQITEELWAWLEQRALRDYRGDVGRTLVALIADARDRERAGQAAGHAGGTEHNPDRGAPSKDPWGDLEQRRRS